MGETSRRGNCSEFNLILSSLKMGNLNQIIKYHSSLLHFDPGNVKVFF